MNEKVLTVNFITLITISSQFATLLLISVTLNFKINSLNNFVKPLSFYTYDSGIIRSVLRGGRGGLSCVEITICRNRQNIIINFMIDKLSVLIEKKTESKLMWLFQNLQFIY